MVTLIALIDYKVSTSRGVYFRLNEINYFVSWLNQGVIDSLIKHVSGRISAVMAWHAEISWLISKSWLLTLLIFFKMHLFEIIRHNKITLKPIQTQSLQLNRQLNGITSFVKNYANKNCCNKKTSGLICFNRFSANLRNIEDFS